MLTLAIALAAHLTPAQDFSAVWEQTAKAIEDSYYGRFQRGDEMRKRLTETAPRARSARSKAEFSRIVNTMIEGFGDSHFHFMTDEDQSYFVMDQLSGGKKEWPNIGVWFKRDADGYTVHMVMNGSAAESAGLCKGDRIVSVDGTPLHPVNSLRGKPSVKVSFRRGEKVLEKSIPVSKQTGMSLFVDGTRKSTRVIENSGKKIGYFRLWTQAGEEFKQLLRSAVYGPLMNTDAMILDLRDGFGGRPEGYADPFFLPGVKLEWKFGPGAVQQQSLGYDKPLIVLINEGSRSAKEVLAHIFKAGKRATLVGRNTSGHVLGTSPLRLNDWAILEIPMVELKTDGQVLEGKGVSPDVALDREHDENGRDLFLDRAIEIAVEKSAR